jgi:hypothetical protein
LSHSLTNLGIVDIAIVGVMELDSACKPILSSALNPGTGASATPTMTITIKSFLVFMTSLLSE